MCWGGNRGMCWGGNRAVSWSHDMGVVLGVVIWVVYRTIVLLAT